MFPLQTDFNEAFWQCEHILIDSRKLISGEGTVFFAIYGERHDGHHYIKDLYERGVRRFVVEKDLSEEIHQLPGIQCCRVKSSVKALQEFVAYKRARFSLPVIGITGSNGKTIVKEWLYSLLEDDFSIVKSPKSYNSQVGVPLSVWELNQQHNLGIFEAGISRVGEMEHLQKMIQPTIGIFTNIGPAHAEGFSSQEQKIKEKLSLFTACQVLVYCKDHRAIDEQAQKLPCKKLTWGQAEEADIHFQLFSKDTWKSKVKIVWQEQSFEVELPFSDRASVENILHCIAVYSYLGMPLDDLEKRLQRLRLPKMRLEIKEGINNCVLIDDAYNNDLAGLSVALSFLDQHSEFRKKTLILSDMLEAGGNERKQCQAIQNLLSQKGLHKFIGIGRKLLAHQDVFQFSEQAFYPSTQDFLAQFQPERFQKEAVLIKGARRFNFERVSAALVQKVHGTRLEVNLDAIEANLNFYKSLLHADTKVMVMVKAFAYGSGSYEVASLLQYHRVDYLAVAYADEGVYLRQKGIRLPVMVMNPATETFDKLLAYNLEPEIYNLHLLESYAGYVKHSRKNRKSPVAKVHIKFDTGMHRLGFEEKDFETLARQLHQYKNTLKVVSAFSHLAGADDEMHNAFSKQQIETFNTLSHRLEKALGYSFIKHICNSAGITRFPEAQLDMVRLGIGLYGVDVNNLYQQQLQCVGTLKTSISQIKEIAKGETIGYGRAGLASSPLRIATIAIGYADGFDRRFSRGTGEVFIRGKLAPVIGNVCMDMTMVDISHIPEAEEGDEVIVFGEQPTISTLAKAIGTIPFEILTNVNGRVKRVFFTE
ncbi:bifunctional UDP-N-acetylmuramoyl-tripeptide:D-alanyl-D-alanine ligase/alanine racemase [Rapidithrix thailandica]|uniref:Alanine racemase n=1 Tax=Rapidithrix thailandica TaxID=413964 RepID=A0AAW9S4B8_9BACT